MKRELNADALKALENHLDEINPNRDRSKSLLSSQGKSAIQEHILSNDELMEVLNKRGPLEEGDENRAKLLASMYGANKEIDLGGNRIDKIFKPTKLRFPENKGFYFKDGEVEKEIEFKGGTLPERFVEVLKDKPKCMAFTICSIDVDTETKKLDSILRSIEDKTGRVHLGTSTNGEDLHIILGDDKYRDLGYRNTIADLIVNCELYNLSCGNKDIDYREEKTKTKRMNL